MKKNGTQGSGAPSRGNVRSVNNVSRSYGSNAGTRQAQRSSSSSASSRSTPKSSYSGSRKKKKKSAGGAVAAVIAFLVVGAGVAAAVLWFNGTIPFWLADKVDVVMADGSEDTLVVADAFDAINIDTFAPGIVNDNIAVGGMTLEEGKAAVAAAQPERPLDINIDLALDVKTLDLDLNSLGLESNMDEVVNEAYSYLKPVPGTEEDPDAIASIYNAMEQLKNNPKSYNTAYTVNPDGLNGIVSQVLTPYIVEVHDAQITGFNSETRKFEYTPENKGYSIDIDKAASQVKEMLDSAQYQGVVTVDAQITEPKLTAEYIEANFGLRSSAYSTTSNVTNRNKNIARACQKMNGTVVNPGEQFSYNGVVGQRTKANGFYEATVILGGQYEKGMGGGICQTSTMLYDAVLKGDLKVVERHTHAWPSSYVDTGLDATVDYGSLDFVFENNSGYPIVVIAYWDSSNSTCHVELYGNKLPDGKKIKLASKITSKTEPSGTEYVANNDMPANSTNTVRSAHTGYVAVTYQVWYDANGNEIERREITTSRYSAHKRKIEVGTKYADGVIGKMDPATGKVTRPDGSDGPTDTSDTSDTTQPTDTQATDTTTTKTKPTDTSATEAPSDTTTTTTEKPADTSASETPADTSASEKPKDTDKPKDTEQPQDTEKPADGGDNGGGEGQ